MSLPDVRGYTSYGSREPRDRAHSPLLLTATVSRSKRRIDKLCDEVMALATWFAGRETYIQRCRRC